MSEKQETDTGVATSEAKIDKGPDVSGFDAPGDSNVSNDSSPPPLKPFSHSTPPQSQSRSAFHPDVPAHQSGPTPPMPPRTFNSPYAVSTSDSQDDPKPHEKQLTIGGDVCLKGGEISSCDYLVLNGTLEDTSLIDASHLEITPVGQFKGTAVVENADIAGRFDGDLTVRGRLTLKEGGEISGSVRYGSIVIEPGGTIRGDMRSINDN
jgi:cytoskeletal protein CcmA (bactofilin family)